MVGKSIGHVTFRRDTPQPLDTPQAFDSPKTPKTLKPNGDVQSNGGLRHTYEKHLEQRDKVLRQNAESRSTATLLSTRKGFQDLSTDATKTQLRLTQPW